MGRFCDDLRSERERCGIALETISHLTKISGRHLRALESGDFDELPGGIFRRGFLRSYLGLLQLPEQPWLDRFEAELRVAAQPVTDAGDIQTFAENIKRSRPASSPKGGLGWSGVLVMIALLLVVGWCVWHFAVEAHVSLADGWPPGCGASTLSLHRAVEPGHFPANAADSRSARLGPRSPLSSLPGLSARV